MTPFYISRSLDKFQVCAFPGCGKDATEESEAPVTQELQYFVASCAEHSTAMVSAASLLASGQKPKAVGRQKLVEVEELFISPPGHKGKCRYSQWDAHQKEAHAPHAQSPKDPEPAAPKKDRQIYATDDWTWPINRDRWRTTDGAVVPLERLTLAEFVSAILGIRAANFYRIPPSLSWTKKLTPPEFTFEYPEEELEVGTKLAKQKLEDMHEEASQRELLQ